MPGVTGPYTILLPWYATLFRGDRFAEALQEIAPVAMRYGATSYHVYRSEEDLYKFWHWTAVPDKLTWERYWYGDEFARWRAEHASWYQVPIVYTIAHEITAGRIEHETLELDV
jgi:hypothetical protein